MLGRWRCSRRRHAPSKEDKDAKEEEEEEEEEEAQNPAARVAAGTDIQAGTRARSERAWAYRVDSRSTTIRRSAKKARM